MKYYAIIVAGGRGTRMQSAVAKQFLLLNEKPVLMHTIQAFFLSEFQPEIILVLPPTEINFWKVLCSKYQFDIPHQIIEGGAERFHSVRNGLMSICNKEEGFIAIHDAVRPIIAADFIDKIFREAFQYGNAIPYIKPSDSVRKINENSTKIIDRNKLILIQTPQIFELKQLKTAYQQRYAKHFTDDASVVEKAGFQLSFVHGKRHNIKITYTEDLALAAFLMKNG